MTHFSDKIQLNYVD